MQLFKKIPFRYNENNYDICIYFEGNLINISTFKSNYPANGYRYQVQLPKNVKIENLLDEKNFTNLIDMARTDIIENRWEKFTKLFN